MKYGLFVCLLGLILVSCAKERDCECVTTFPDGKTETETHVVQSQSKDLAIASCTDENFSGDQFTKKCGLKKK